MCGPRRSRTSCLVCGAKPQDVVTAATARSVNQQLWKINNQIHSQCHSQFHSQFGSRASETHTNDGETKRVRFTESGGQKRCEDAADETEVFEKIEESLRQLCVVEDLCNDEVAEGVGDHSSAQSIEVYIMCEGS